ncbi:MAG: AI-2E family transporter [Methylocystis sp.]
MVTVNSSRISGHDVQGSALTAVVFGGVIIACLYFGREVLMPIALAVLMSFLLAPPVRLLQGWRAPRGLAIAVVVAIAFAAIFSLVGLMAVEVNQLASDLPRYQSTLSEKIQNLRGATAVTGTLERASEVLQELKSDLNMPKRGAPARAIPAPGGGPPQDAIQVEIAQPDSSALQTLGAIASALVAPLTTSAIVVIFLIFILGQRQDLRNRLVRLVGSSDIPRTTAAFDDAAQRLSRLFLTQLTVNSGFGFVTGVGLWIIGVPSAPLWGMLSAIFRFVPYIGPLISAIFPLILAASAGTGWAMVLWTALLFVIAEIITGQIIEPLAYGHSSGLSPIAVITSATFWMWLWGPVGLILATPLTVCLVVLGRHVDRLAFLTVILGDQPALMPAELVYQRMLARDPVEASEQARLFLREKPLLAYYEEVLLEGLKLAAADAERGLLDPERTLLIRDAVADIVDDLGDHKDIPESATEAIAEALTDAVRESPPKTARELAGQGRSRKPVLCIPGLGLIDEALATILAQLLERKGVDARAEEAGAWSKSRVASLDVKDVGLICLCYMETPSPAQMHFAVRRLRRKAPAAIIFIALLGATSAVEDEEVVQTLVKLDLIKSTLHATLERILAITADAGDASPPDTSLIINNKKPILDSSAEGDNLNGEASRESAPILAPNSASTEDVRSSRARCGALPDEASTRGGVDS